MKPGLVIVGVILTAGLGYLVYRLMRKSPVPSPVPGPVPGEINKPRPSGQVVVPLVDLSAAGWVPMPKLDVPGDIVPTSLEGRQLSSLSAVVGAKNSDYSGIAYYHWNAFSSDSMRKTYVRVVQSGTVNETWYRPLTRA